MDHPEYDSDASSGSISMIDSDQEEEEQLELDEQASSTKIGKKRARSNSSESTASRSFTSADDKLIFKSESRPISPSNPNSVPSTSNARDEGKEMANDDHDNQPSTSTAVQDAPQPPSDFSNLNFKLKLAEAGPTIAQMLMKVAPNLTYEDAVKEINLSLGTNLPPKCIVNPRPRVKRLGKIAVHSVGIPVVLSKEERQKAQVDSLIISEAILAVASISPNDPRILARLIIGSFQEWDPTRSSVSSLPSSSLPSKSTETKGRIPDIAKLNEYVALIHQTEADSSIPSVETFGLLASLAQEFHRQVALNDTKEGEGEFRLWKSSVSQSLGGQKKQVFRLELGQRVDLICWAFGTPLALALLPHLRGFNTCNSIRTCDKELFKKLIHFLLDGTWIDGVDATDLKTQELARFALQGPVAEALRIADHTIKNLSKPNLNPNDPSRSYFLEKNSFKRLDDPRDSSDPEWSLGLIFQGCPVRKVANEFAERLVMDNRQVRQQAALGFPTLQDDLVSPRCSRGILAASTRTIQLRPAKPEMIRSSVEWKFMTPAARKTYLYSSFGKSVKDYESLFSVNLREMVETLTGKQVNTIFFEVAGKGVKGKGGPQVLSKEYLKSRYNQIIQADRTDQFKRKYGNNRRRNTVDNGKPKSRKKVKKEDEVKIEVED